MSPEEMQKKTHGIVFIIVFLVVMITIYSVGIMVINYFDREILVLNYCKSQGFDGYSISSLGIFFSENTYYCSNNDNNQTLKISELGDIK